MAKRLSSTAVPPWKRVFSTWIFGELQLDGFERSEQVLPEGVDALQVVLVAERFDYVGVVVCQDAGDIAACECGSDCIAGLFEDSLCSGEPRYCLAALVDWPVPVAAGCRARPGRR